ncbi:MAG: hypothetical protein K8I27_00030 [Planctomycetes bacterium]|nr:hypothetical protein [Planctomycetota bacterium]
MRFVRPAITLLLVCALCAGLVVSADDEPAPREFTQEELDSADALRLTLSTEQQTLYNGLRFLLRPEFETDLMSGRRIRPCVLEPFEDKSDAPLTRLECLRLWAVLQSGLPVTPALDRQLQRFLDTPAPGGNDLAPLAVMVLTARAAWLRDSLGRKDDLKLKVENLLRAGDALTDATSAKSSLVQRDQTQPRWVGNILWRALMMRAALEMDIEIDAKLWETDLKALEGAHKKEVAWSGLHKPAINEAYDLHPNLMALAAVGLASNLPDKTLRRSGTKAVETMGKHVTETLDRLDREYGERPWRGARLLVALSLSAEYSPERESADLWRASLRRRGVAELEPGGYILPRDTMARDLGLHETAWTRLESTTCETALTCIALSGGLYATGRAPLAGRELDNIGRLFYALAVLHANSAKQGAADFQGRVNLAISDGCDYLAEIQNDDGSFPGMHSGRPGNTALCLLALMHGGWSPEHEAIKRGVDWLLQPEVLRRAGTYDSACVLMCLQKYYEAAQRKAGILYVDTPEDFEAARRQVWNDIGEAHRKAITAILNNIDAAYVGGKQGGWNYSAANTTGRVHSDNSLSQYAMLGCKAASLLGAEFGIAVFADEAERLIRQYTPDENAEAVEYVHVEDEREGDKDDRGRKTASDFNDTIKPGGWSYSCGSTGYNLQMTAAGISSLTICMDELKVRGKLKQDLAHKIGLTIRGAEALVRAQYYTPEQFSGARNALMSGRSDGWGTFYNLYSVERACVMAGISKLEGELDWYRVGAEGLIENQNLDGSWGVERELEGVTRDMSANVNNCLAILFLKQASMPVITEHKKREKEREEREDKDKPKSPITGK